MNDKTINTLRVAYNLFQIYASDSYYNRISNTRSIVENKYASYALASELYLALQCDTACSIELSQEEKDILKAL